MKYKLKYAHYDEETGVSTVEISTRYGNFSATVHMLADEKYPSKYFGCELAEIKALKKAEKMRLRELRAELKGLQDFFAEMMDTRNFNGYSFPMLKLGEKMVKLRQDIDVCKHNINQLSSNYHKLILSRDKKLGDLHKEEDEE